jgi:hypothetical protein
MSAVHPFPRQCQLQQQEEEMVTQFIQWLALFFMAAAIIPAGAHLAELPNKIALGQAEYLVVQQIYAGWSLFGIAIIGAILTSLAFTIALIWNARPYAFALAAFLLAVANIAIFFIWTFPTNKATQNWTVTPENWEALRSQWEYSHAANALVIFAAFACLLVAVSRHLTYRAS